MQENRFTKCDTCTEIKKEKEKTMDQEKIRKLNKMMEDHNKLQMYVLDNDKHLTLHYRCTKNGQLVSV